MVIRSSQKISQEGTSRTTEEKNGHLKKDSDRLKVEELHRFGFTNLAFWNERTD